MKIYNKGTRPIVYKQDLTGTEVIHPNKFAEFPEKRAKEIIEKYEDACSEQEFKKHLQDLKRKADVEEQSDEFEKTPVKKEKKK